MDPGTRSHRQTNEARRLSSSGVCPGLVRLVAAVAALSLGCSHGRPTTKRPDGAGPRLNSAGARVPAARHSPPHGKGGDAGRISGALAEGLEDTQRPPAAPAARALEILDEFGFRAVPRPRRGDVVLLSFRADPYGVSSVPYRYTGQKVLFAAKQDARPGGRFVPGAIYLDGGRAVGLDLTNANANQARDLASQYPDVKILTCFDCEDLSAMVAAAKVLRAGALRVVISSFSGDAEELRSLLRAAAGRIAYLALVHTSAEAAMETLARTQPGLGALRILDGYLTDRGLAQICKLGRLRSLELGNRTDDPELRAMHLSPRGLRCLGRLRHLTTLTLQNLDLDGAGLAAALKLTGLRSLSVRMNPILDADLARIPHLSKLETLDLRDTEITDAGLQYLGGLRHLRHLRLANTKVTDRGLRHLAALAGLQRLDLSQTQVCGEGLEQLARLPRLEGLRLAGSPLDKPLEKLDRLARLKHLRWLDLTGTEIDDAKVRFVSSLSRLEYLDLEDNTKLTRRGIRHLVRLGRLRSLNLGDTTLGDESADLLGRLRGLRALSLRQTRIGDAGVRRLAGLHLWALNLEVTKVTGKSLCALAGMPSLRWLSLWYTNVDGACLARLANLRHLSFLWLPEEVEVPEKLLQGMPRLTLDQ